MFAVVQYWSAVFITCIAEAAVIRMYDTMIKMISFLSV